MKIMVNLIHDMADRVSRSPARSPTRIIYLRKVGATHLAVITFEKAKETKRLSLYWGKCIKPTQHPAAYRELVALLLTGDAHLEEI